MNYLSVEDLSKSFGDKTLFENLSFGLQKGDKVALVASNGAGKTTLMRMLAGKEDHDTGTITFADGIRVGFLEQQPDFDGQLTINELITGSHTYVMQLIRDYELALKNQTEHFSPESQRELESASTKMEFHKAWDYDRRLKQLLTKFEINDLSQIISTLSGGQKKRLSLALLLLDEPELLLMDEPTNHLDIEMIEWLEKYLKQINITFLMVTHDRYFLDRVCNNILELFFKRVYHHKGNYAYYIQKSSEREETIRIETEKAGQLLKTELEWMRRMPQARTTKSKSRIDAYYELKEKASQKRNQQQIQLDVTVSRTGSKILEMRSVNKKFDDIVIARDFDYMFTKGEKIGVVGKNGVGKSSFLNLITGLEKLDSGEIIVGDTIVFGYFTQESYNFDEDRTVIEVVKEIAEIIPLSKGRSATASQMLQKFMFPPEMQNQPISLLSGGEKRRLHLLTILVKNPNFLILDEPTNDLDLMTLQTLEVFLQNFAGCLLIVSHDRYFMDQVVDQLFIFEGDGKVRGFTGNYSDYRSYLDEAEKEKKLLSNQEKEIRTISKSSQTQTKRKMTYKEQKEFEQLEHEIHTFELEKKKLENRLAEIGTDYIELDKATKRIAELIGQIDEKSFRWLELDEIGNEQ
jgi:ATP-binding cassette subfamily F protein uup